MNKRSPPKLSESDLELFNRVVADVKPLKFPDQSFINKKNFKSKDLDNDFQNYCFNNISNITTHKGIQESSYIAFIRKN